MTTKAKSEYIADAISENSDNPRHLWSSINNIETIRAKFPDKVQNIPSVQKTEIRSKMSVLERATEDEIKKLILNSSSKSCDLDPILISVLENARDILTTPITDKINISMETSTFPQNVNEARVRPLLKNISS